MAGPLPFLSLQPRALLQRWSHRRGADEEGIDLETTPGGNPWATRRGTLQSDGNRIEILVDGHAVFQAARDAVVAARRSLRLMQMSFETDFVPAFEAAESPTLASLVREAGARGVAVRLLLSKIEPVDALGYDAAARYFAGCPGIQVHPFPLRSQLQHAKLMVVDDEVAFVFGSLFVQAYFDYPSHPVTEPRRGKGIPVVGSRPVHDVALRIQGPAVADIDHCFADLWNHRAQVEQRPADRVEACPRPPPRGEQAVQVVRTLPHGLLGDRPEGERDIFEAYLRGLRQARRFVYIENQYLTSTPLAQAVREAVEREPSLEAILLLNPRVDVPVYLRRQRKLLATTLAHPRIGAFSLWSTESGPRPMVQRAYIHSKSALIDDVWACLGTANLDGFSLHGAAEVGMPRSRNVETNLVLLDGIAGKPGTGVVGDVRRHIWGEHLGREAGGLRKAPMQGWLALWRGVAKANAAALAQGRAPASRVLPFTASPRRGGDAAALRRLGIDPDGLDLKA